MRSIHCDMCEIGKSCGKGHLYVIQLRDEISDNYAVKSEKGYIYVGSTSLSVEQRGRDNFTLRDGTYVEPSELHKDRKLPENEQKWSEERDWKYNTTSIKKIRSHFKQYRTDLVFFQNPIIYDKKDPNKLERMEGRLADKLRNRGWRVINKVTWKNRDGTSKN